MTDPELFIAVPASEGGARELVKLLKAVCPTLPTRFPTGMYLLERLRRELEGELEQIDRIREHERVLAEREKRPTILEKRG